MTTRRSRFGFPLRPPKLRTIRERYAPLKGWLNQPAVAAGPESVVSGRNFRIHDGRLQTRPGLQVLGTNAASVGTVTGAFLYNDISGAQVPVVSGATSLSYLQGVAWSRLSYVQLSTGTNDYPSGSREDPWFATPVYLPRVDENLFVVANGANALMAWGGPTLNDTTFSTLTGAPVARDVVTFDNRPVAWNITAPTGARYVTRVQWPVAGDPEDWNEASIGAGFEDLVDMRGSGTRIFVLSDSLVLATDREIWVGRRVGLPFVFQFQAFARNLGIPFPKAAIQTKDGIFWLNDDDMVYQMRPDFQIVPIGAPVRRYLHNNLNHNAKDEAFFAFDEMTDCLTLFYKATSDTSQQRAFTLCTTTGTWSPEFYGGTESYLYAGVGPRSTQTGFIWGTMQVTPYDSVNSRWDQLTGLGIYDEPTPFVVGSGGTAFSFLSSATSDNAVVIEQEAWFGANYGADAEHMKHIQRVRLDISTTNGASTLTVGVVDAPGSVIRQQYSVSVPATSYTSQIKQEFSVSATYPQVLVRTQGGLTIDALTVEGQLRGRGT